MHSRDLATRNDRNVEHSRQLSQARAYLQYADNEPRVVRGMAGKIFINYRRDDVPGDARGIREALVAEFGKSSVFMDVDNLLAGQRFDRELEKALSQCDVLLAVMGPRWMELLTDRAKTSERDYVREEIAAALKRNIVVIPVRSGREGSIAPLPRADQLPDDIRDLVLHQRQDVAHERFGRDMAELIAALRAIRRGDKWRIPRPALWSAAALTTALTAAGALFYFNNSPHPASSAKPIETSKLKTVAEDIKERSQSAIGAAANLLKNFRQPAERTVDLPHESTARGAPGDTIRDCPSLCPELIVVPGGTFRMGSDDGEKGRGPNEGPVQTVTISKPFAVGKYEVTFAEWDACVKDGGCVHAGDDQGWGRDKLPAVDISWDDAQQYTGWLRKQTGKPYRLLTEAEWEYAARAGTTTPFSTGDTITTADANFDGNYTYGNTQKGEFRQRTTAVGSFKPNAYGLYDMHGNVWEWVQDCYEDNYTGLPLEGGARTSGDCSGRVARGGAWASDPGYLRSADRFKYSSGSRGDDTGFRVARSLD